MSWTDLTDDDLNYVSAVSHFVRSLLKVDNLMPEQIIGIGHVLDILENFPNSTSALDCTISISSKVPPKGSYNIRSADFSISSTEVSLDIGGVVYDPVIGSDSYSVGEWRIEDTGYRDTDYSIHNGLQEAKLIMSGGCDIDISFD